jgi:hypothetical protein
MPWPNTRRSAIKYEESVEKPSSESLKVNAEAVAALTIELPETLRRAAKSLNN